MHCGKDCDRRGNTASNNQIKYNTNIMLLTWIIVVKASTGFYNYYNLEGLVFLSALKMESNAKSCYDVRS